MKKQIVHVLSLFCCLLLPILSIAAENEAIYQASVPVINQSAENRLKAEQSALGLVLQKVSGDVHVLDNKDLKAALVKAESLIDEFSYTPVPTDSAAPYLLNIRFDSKGVNRLLRNNGANVWSKSRPLLLVWAEYETPGQAAVIIDAESPLAFQSLLKSAAEGRGLPIILPTMDIADLNQVNIHDILTLNLPSLKQASKRYGNDGMLVMKIAQLSEGFSLQAKLAVQGKEWTWDIADKNLENLTRTFINNVADTLLASSGSLGSQNEPASLLTLKVTGITEQGDLGELIQYITHLLPVADVEPLRVDAGEVILKITLRSSKQSFIQALEEGQKMQPNADSTEDVLDYQWSHSL